MFLLFFLSKEVKLHNWLIAKWSSFWKQLIVNYRLTDYIIIINKDIIYIYIYISLLQKSKDINISITIKIKIIKLN